ncbi:DUF359 domain-containing protein [Candidatus Bathyarchaeota archaeon]|nr:DUF359 domain-containing protein [Candidatus Bathyarchaeota archaeon]MBS7617906.1 DUF359 domain-containing protein [Candidatus Bathyarchaeota archaeon]
MTNDFLRVLTEDLRRLLKKPVGILIRGAISETKYELKELLKSKEKTKLIAVGDVISKTIIEIDLKADLYVTDSRSLRMPVEEPRLASIAGRVYMVRNPPGHISSEAENAVKKALADECSSWIKVEGEEDLLTLTVIAEAPLNSIVLYGQPNEGIVVVQVDEKTKQWAKNIIGNMPTIQKNNYGLEEDRLENP